MNVSSVEAEREKKIKFYSICNDFFYYSAVGILIDIYVFCENCLNIFIMSQVFVE